MTGVQTCALPILLDRAGKAAAAGEDATVVRGVVEVLVRQGGDVDIARIKQGLQLLKGDNTVDIGYVPYQLRPGGLQQQS